MNVNLENIKQVYFIGIGGIGMSALARYFHHEGCLVFGYDKTETSLTRAINAEGIEIVYEDDINQIPEIFKSPSNQSLIVFTPAVPQELSIKYALLEVGHILYKRAEILGLISRNHYTIAVGGTHGKTTTSCLIAHILIDSGRSCLAFLGGISTNYRSNVLISDSNLLVVEADEYDRSFLTLHPDIAVVTATDADHLDIYHDRSHLIDSFKLFIDQVSENGIRIIKKGLDLPTDISYAQGQLADAYADNRKIINGEYYFDYHHGELTISDIHIGIPGDHNIENAVAAIAAVLSLGISADQIRIAMSNFKGVKRRFEYILKTDTHIYIDDYAHHPEELRACFNAVRQLYPQKKLTVIFQPHLYSRTRDFVSGFADVLGSVEELILMPIYPARERAIEGITSYWLLEQVKAVNKRVLNAGEILEYIEKEQPELLVTVGAGDIDKLVRPLKEVLSNV